MKKLTYRIVLFILKLKGIKKNFSESPINYLKVRKEDVYKPKGSFFKQNISNTFPVLNSTITEISTSKQASGLVLFVHGGAFISGPAKHHWDSIKTIAKQTKQTIWLVNYPKAPEHKIDEISQNIDAVYQKALTNFDAQNITLIGDSVGATLITALTQRLIKNNLSAPKQLILISPVMDACMDNPAIDTIEPNDPMLAKAGVLSAKKMCAFNGNLKDANISPINGEFNKFPKTVFFAATHDIMYPDELLAIEKLKVANVNLEVIKGEEMPHIWPLLPVMKEAKTALQQIIDRINA